MSKEKTFRCKGCGDIFPYKRREPKYCEGCRKIKLIHQINQYRKRGRAALKKGEAEEHFGGKSTFIKSVHCATHEEIGRIIGMDPQRVAELERKVLLKIRTNPELRNLWGSLREILADGHEWPQQIRLIRDPVKQGNLLLDYQQAVADWLETHDEIMERGCTVEALELMIEIERFRQRITDMLTGER